MYEILEPHLAIAPWILFLGTVVSTVASGIASWFSNKKTNATNLEINQQNNEFNAEQAQVARNWQEQMYQNYESPSSQVQQRLQAGINPLDGITSQAVGSASTASASSASPQIPFDFTSAFGDIGNKSLLYGQLKSQKLQNTYQENLNEQQATDLDLKKEDLNSKRYDNALKAIELGYKDDALAAEIANAKAQAESLGWSSKRTEAEIERIKLDFKMAEEAYNNGANSYQDTHDIATADIAQKNAQTDLIKLQKDVEQFEFGLSKLYTEDFMKLDLDQRKQEVKEYLDTADVRVSIFNVQKAFTKLAVDDATRQAVENELKHRANKVLLTRLAESAEDGGSFDTLLLKGFIENPNALLDVLSTVSNVLSVAKPSPTYIVKK